MARRIYGGNRLMEDIVDAAKDALIGRWITVVSGPGTPEYLKGIRGKQAEIVFVHNDGMEIGLNVRTGSGKVWEIGLDDVEPDSPTDGDV